MAISPCPETDVIPSCSVARTSTPVVKKPALPANRSTNLPVNDAPYAKILYDDPVTGQRVRSRVISEVGRIAFEACAPIRTFPAYRGRRSHQGRYWFSRSQTQVQFESRFEMTALMVMDFDGNATAVSSNPFWLLWPKGTKPVRHAPDFFVRRRDGSVLIVDVKPAERITDKDRAQHERTRDVCGELGWEYKEFTMLDVIVERNLRLLAGYRNPRFAPPGDSGALIAAQVRAAGEQGLRLSELIDTAALRVDLTGDRVLCAVYHMLWGAKIHVDLNCPLTWNTVVRA